MRYGSDQNEDKCSGNSEVEIVGLLSKRESVGMRGYQGFRFGAWVEADTISQGREEVHLAGEALRLLWDVLCLQCL